MISVEQAGKIIQSETRDFGNEEIELEISLDRVLAENIYADRDLPPFNRSTVDGIAILSIAYKKNIRQYMIKATQAAGEAPIDITSEDECIEIMTGSALSKTVDTVIRYEDIEINDGAATIQTNPVVKGQNIHKKGADKKQGEVIVNANQHITASIIGVCASVGKTTIMVKKLPRVVIITTGDELVDADTTPSPYQLRRSNDITINAVLQQYKIQADILHVKDDYTNILEELSRCLKHYDVILLTGGVSMGKFDYIPQVLRALKVKQSFHKVQQRPGKPFWFGTHQSGVVVFAFPGNPVSTFMCLYRYFLPWLESSLRVNSQLPLPAMLNKNVTFNSPLQYFIQVKLWVNKKGQLLAQPLEGNGSGDFANLVSANAFMELPLKQNEFKKGEIYNVWPYRDFETMW